MHLPTKDLDTIRAYTAAKAVYEMACSMLERGVGEDHVRLATDKAFHALGFDRNLLYSGVRNAR